MPDPSDVSDQRPVDRHLAVLEVSPNAIVAVRDDGRIAYANPQVAATFGHRPADLIGLPIEVLVPEAMAARQVRHRTRFLAQPIARPMGIGLDLAARRADGSTFPVEVSLSIVSEAGRQLVMRPSWT